MRNVMASLIPMALAAVLVVPGEAQTHDMHMSVVEVDAEDYAFRIPAEIRSGWNTFRLANAGEEHHFMLIARLPDGITFDDYVTDVIVPFSHVWYQLRDGVIGQEAAMPMLGEHLPDWFWTVEFHGGPGFLAPGGSAEATVYLEPGSYVVECYVRTADGEFHSMEGMLDPLEVVADPSGQAPPAAGLRVRVSEEGMMLDGQPTAGRTTFEAHFVDLPEGTFGHDVQVLRLDDDVLLDDVLQWLNFLNVDGLTNPVPGTFVGGINMMPAGSTGYFTVDLEPGRHLLVAQYTGVMGVHTAFTVAPAT